MQSFQEISCFKNTSAIQIVVQFEITDKNNIVVSGGNDGVLSIWDIEKNKLLTRLYKFKQKQKQKCCHTQILKQGILALAISSDGKKTIAEGNSDSSISLWNLES